MTFSEAKLCHWLALAGKRCCDLLHGIFTGIQIVFVAMERVRQLRAARTLRYLIYGRRSEERM